MNDDKVHKAAYARWEAEGRPDGEHERHWREAEDETRDSLPQTWSSDHSGGVSPATTVDQKKTSKTARAAKRPG
jgi:hypothetical protein